MSLRALKIQVSVFTRVKSQVHVVTCVKTEAHALRWLKLKRMPFFLTQWCPGTENNSKEQINKNTIERTKKNEQE